MRGFELYDLLHKTSTTYIVKKFLYYARYWSHTQTKDQNKRKRYETLGDNLRWPKLFPVENYCNSSLAACLSDLVFSCGLRQVLDPLKGISAGKLEDLGWLRVFIKYLQQNFTTESNMHSLIWELNISHAWWSFVHPSIYWYVLGSCLVVSDLIQDELHGPKRRRKNHSTASHAFSPKQPNKRANIKTLFLESRLKQQCCIRLKNLERVEFCHVLALISEIFSTWEWL